MAWGYVVLRKSRYDPFILLVMLVAFLYCFFVQGFHVVYWDEGELGPDGVWHRGDEVRGVEYSSGLLIIPLFFLVVFILFVFGDELEPYGLGSLLVLLRRRR